jgi:hypothetical protein
MSTPKPLRRKTTVAEHLADTDQFRGKVVIAAIDFHHTLLYVTDATPGQQPAKLVAEDPRGYFRKVSHDAGNPRGIYEDDSTEYWQAISDAVAAAGAILVLGHGQGRANASHHWVAYVEKHRARHRCQDRGRGPCRHRSTDGRAGAATGAAAPRDRASPGLQEMVAGESRKTRSPCLRDSARQIERPRCATASGASLDC